MGCLLQTTPSPRPRLTRPQPLGPTLFTTLNPSLPAHSHSPPVRRPACQMLLKSLHPTHRQHSSSNGRTNYTVRDRNKNQPPHHLNPMHTKKSGLNVQIYREKSLKSSATRMSWPKMHKSTKNLGTTSKFQAPERVTWSKFLIENPHTYSPPYELSRRGARDSCTPCDDDATTTAFSANINSKLPVIFVLYSRCSLYFEAFLNRVQVCDRPPSTFVKRKQWRNINIPISGGTGNCSGPQSWGYVVIESRNLLHTNMFSEFPHTSVTSFMIYDPAILSWEKGSRRTMGSQMGRPRGQRHR